MFRRLLLRMVMPTMGLMAFRRLLEQSRPKADLRGQVVLITGGSRGLGYLLAREFGFQGCRVAICARDIDELEQARLDLQEQGIADVLAVPCDITDPAQVKEMVNTVTESHGVIDILVNNAAIIQVGPLRTLTRRDFEEAMNIIFWGMVNCTDAVLSQMIGGGRGRIVNITSIGGKISVPHLLPYNAAKFAAVGYSEGLRAELLPKGIQVTTIVPGLMRTGSFFNASFKSDVEGEFTWFGLASSLPLISMNAERAARQIVEAVQRGEAERILTMPASLGARVHGLFPGLTSTLIGVLSPLVMPDAKGRRKRGTRGLDIYNRMTSGWAKRLMLLGQRAAPKLNQFEQPEVQPETSPVSEGNTP